MCLHQQGENCIFFKVPNVITWEIVRVKRLLSSFRLPVHLRVHGLQISCLNSRLHYSEMCSSTGIFRLACFNSNCPHAFFKIRNYLTLEWWDNSGTRTVFCLKVVSVKMKLRKTYFSCLVFSKDCARWLIIFDHTGWNLHELGCTNLPWKGFWALIPLVTYWLWLDIYISYLTLSWSLEKNSCGLSFITGRKLWLQKSTLSISTATDYC